MTLVTEPGDALTKGTPIGEPECGAMLLLLGQTVARLNDPAPLAVDERDSLRTLAGLLAARLHEAALAQRLAYIEFQIAGIQRELTARAN